MCVFVFCVFTGEHPDADPRSHCQSGVRGHVSSQALYLPPEVCYDSRRTGGCMCKLIDKGDMFFYRQRSPVSQVMGRWLLLILLKYLSEEKKSSLGRWNLVLGVGSSTVCPLII